MQAQSVEYTEKRELLNTNMIYESENTSLIMHIPSTVVRLLDLGCGTGNLGKRIKSSHNCEVVGITHSESEAPIAREKLDSVIVMDLNEFCGEGLTSFDTIVMSHVLEHLYRPDELLSRLHTVLSEQGTIVVALPNTLYWKQRLKFILGEFRYTEGGVMDSTHYRFYDWKTAHELLTNSGYDVTLSHADGHFPLPFLRRIFKSGGTFVDVLTSRILPGLFGTQFIMVAKKSTVVK